MQTSRNKNNLAAVLRELPENTIRNQSQNALNLGMAEKYITLVSEETKGRVTSIFSQQFEGRSHAFWVPCLIRRISSEPTSSDLFRSSSGNIQKQQLRKSGNHWGLFPRQPPSRSGVNCQQHQQSKWFRAGRDKSQIHYQNIIFLNRKFTDNCLVFFLMGRS